MKPVSGDAKPRKGVSIPSQRRFLFYWSQILSNTAPRGFWGMPSEGNAPPAQRVRIPSITVRIREIRGTKAMAVKIVNGVLEKTSGRRVGAD
jgi:phosphatidylinositol-3,4,5-trisphosphate 3-phosphatase/dual-specificity protein phosphatase PTEN